MPENLERFERELALLTTLGQVLTAAKGYGHPEVERLQSRSCIGEAGSKTPRLFPVLLGLTIHRFFPTILISGPDAGLTYIRFKIPATGNTSSKGISKLVSRSEELPSVGGVNSAFQPGATPVWENPVVSYSVCFDGRELWGAEADPTVKVSVEAFEPYLEGGLMSARCPAWSVQDGTRAKDKEGAAF